MTLPRHFSLDDNNFQIQPAEEVKNLRLGHKNMRNVDIESNSEVLLNHIQGNAMVVNTVINPQAAREVGLYVLRSSDGKEKTRISLLQNTDKRLEGSSLQIDISESSLRNDVEARPPEIGPLKIKEDELLRLQIFIDRSIIEVFANDRQCLTIRVYPEREDSQGISLFARGSKARLISLDAWQMKSIWPELRN